MESSDHQALDSEDEKIQQKRKKHPCGFLPLKTEYYDLATNSFNQYSHLLPSYIYSSCQLQAKHFFLIRRSLLLGPTP